MIYTVKGFGIVDDTEVGVFLEFPSFLYEPANVQDYSSHRVQERVITSIYWWERWHISGKVCELRNIAVVIWGRYNLLYSHCAHSLSHPLSVNGNHYDFLGFYFFVLLFLSGYFATYRDSPCIHVSYLFKVLNFICVKLWLIYSDIYFSNWIFFILRTFQVDGAAVISLFLQL